MINHCRLTALKCWPWKFSMVVCITSRNFWTWKFPWPFWIITPMFWRWRFPSPISIALKYDAQKIHAFFSTQNQSIFFILEIFSIFLYILDMTLFFFLAIIDVNPWISCKSEYAKKTCLYAKLGTFQYTLREPAILAELPNNFATKRKVVKNSIYLAFFF